MRGSEGMTLGKDSPSELWEKQSPHALFQSTDFCRRRVLKHDQQDGPQTWGAATGLDAIPDAQGPDARWVTPGFRVRLRLCCGLDTILGARPLGKMSREKRNQYPSRLFTKCPNPEKYLVYRLCKIPSKPATPLTVPLRTFGCFYTCALNRYYSAGADGNPTTQVVLPHFVWGKSVFSHLQVQLILTNPGAVRNHTPFPCHLPGLRLSERGPCFLSLSATLTRTPLEESRSLHSLLVRIHILICS